MASKKIYTPTELENMTVEQLRQIDKELGDNKLKPQPSIPIDTSLPTVSGRKVSPSPVTTEGETGIPGPSPFIPRPDGDLGLREDECEFGQVGEMLPGTSKTCSLCCWINTYNNIIASPLWIDHEKTNEGTVDCTANLANGDPPALDACDADWNWCTNTKAKGGQNGIYLYYSSPVSGEDLQVIMGSTGICPYNMPVSNYSCGNGVTSDPNWSIHDCVGCMTGQETSPSPCNERSGLLMHSSLKCLYGCDCTDTGCATNGDPGGACGGSVTIDACGVCGGGCVQDEAGVWSSNCPVACGCSYPDGKCDCAGSILDDCNKCGGLVWFDEHTRTDSHNQGTCSTALASNGFCPGDYCDIGLGTLCPDNLITSEMNDVHVRDCDGTCGGLAIIDVCGVCSGGSAGLTQHVAGSDLDVCDVCFGDNSTCKDCNGSPNGSAVIDMCGDCVGGSTGAEACEEDCEGTWGGSAGDITCCDGLHVCVSGVTTCDSLGRASVNDCFGVCGGPGPCDTYVKGMAPAGTGGFNFDGYSDAGPDTGLNHGEGCKCNCAGDTWDQCGNCGGDYLDWGKSSNVCVGMSGANCFSNGKCSCSTPNSTSIPAGHGTPDKPGGIMNASCGACAHPTAQCDNSCQPNIAHNFIRNWQNYGGSSAAGASPGQPFQCDYLDRYIKNVGGTSTWTHEGVGIDECPAVCSIGWKKNRYYQYIGESELDVFNQGLLKGCTTPDFVGQYHYRPMCDAHGYGTIGFYAHHDTSYPEFWQCGYAECRANDGTYTTCPLGCGYRNLEECEAAGHDFCQKNDAECGIAPGDAFTWTGFKGVGLEQTWSGEFIEGSLPPVAVEACAYHDLDRPSKIVVTPDLQPFDGFYHVAFGQMSIGSWRYDHEGTGDCGSSGGSVWLKTITCGGPNKDCWQLMEQKCCQNEPAGVGYTPCFLERLCTGTFNCSSLDETNCKSKTMIDPTTGSTINPCIWTRMCPSPGNVNGDEDNDGNDTFNILDIVLMANCVLAGNCSSNCEDEGDSGGLPNGGSCYACAADVNGDFNFNVLDIVQLANCVLAQNCGGQKGGKVSNIAMAPGNYTPPTGVSIVEQDGIMQNILDTFQQYEPPGGWVSRSPNLEDLAAVGQVVTFLDGKGWDKNKATSLGPGGSQSAVATSAVSSRPVGQAITGNVPVPAPIINPIIPYTSKKVSSNDDVLVSCEGMGMISCPNGGCAMDINQCGEPKVRRQGGAAGSCAPGMMMAADGSCISTGNGGGGGYRRGGMQEGGNICPRGTIRAADGTCISAGS